MNFTPKKHSQRACPKGVLGTIVGKIMNYKNNDIYNWGIDNINISENKSVLDIGCGGGKLLNKLSRKVMYSNLCGIDHSQQMIQLSNRVNKNINNIEIKKASVSNIPYDNSTFEIITAIETIQFWPTLEKSIEEVYRVLKESGTFIIINTYSTKNERQLKNQQYYIDTLTRCGFKNIECNMNSNKNWIMLKAYK